MTDEKPLIIPIDSIEKDFEDFLSPESNKRIIFSGPFGIGKTYFLDKFFKTRKEKYLPIFLRPINYSLLSNEDIFRLIKYDILFEIIKNREFIFDDIPDFTEMDFAQFFVSQNLFLPLINLLKTLPKIKTIVTGVEEIERLIKKYSEGWEQINSNQKLKYLSDFRTETETSFLLEFDHVSQLISDQLDEISKSENLKKVLIIDDLDRLDPEHIFRLFNVFSAHFDQVNYYSDGENIKDNKFGFDKIIFVCDIENIRKLFSYRYGLGVDFSGYIDKFYSRRIYYLFHKNSFEQYIFPFFETKFSNIDLGVDNREMIRIFLQFLFQGNQLNIRDVYRLTDLHLSAFITKEGKFKNGEGIIQINKLKAPANTKLNMHPICIALYILSFHFGSTSTLKEKIENALISTKTNEENERDLSVKLKNIFPGLILFADHKKHGFQYDDQGSVLFRYYNFTYSLLGGYQNQTDQEGPMWFRIELKSSENKVNKGIFYTALSEAAIAILESGVLNL